MSIFVIYILVKTQDPALRFPLYYRFLRHTKNTQTQRRTHKHTKAHTHINMITDTNELPPTHVLVYLHFKEKKEVK